MNSVTVFFYRLHFIYVIYLNVIFCENDFTIPDNNFSALLIIYFFKRYFVIQDVEF